jgi:hypothetical protein
VSDLTVMNRWRRYQLARLDGLISGLRGEARRLPAEDLELEIIRLGGALRDRLAEHCDEVRERIHHDLAEGRPASIPDLAYERF